MVSAGVGIYCWILCHGVISSSNVQELEADMTIHYISAQKSDEYWIKHAHWKPVFHNVETCIAAMDNIQRHFSVIFPTCVLVLYVDDTIYTVVV